MDVASALNDDRDSDIERLVRRIAQGDSVAETEFVRRFQYGVTVLARRHARPNESRVADVVQTVLMHAIERLRGGGLREPGALPGYVRACVVHEVAALYRDTYVRSAQDISAVDGHLAELVVRDTPESRAAHAQQVSRVLRAIHDMSVPRDRELLLRFYVQEQTRDEVCSALGIDETHFRRVLFRARARLQNAVESPS